MVASLLCTFVAHIICFSCFLSISLYLSLSLSLSLFLSLPLSLSPSLPLSLSPSLPLSLSLSLSSLLSPLSPSLYLCLSVVARQVSYDALYQAAQCICMGCRLPYSELLEKRLFRSRANRRLVVRFISACKKIGMVMMMHHGVMTLCCFFVAISDALCINSSQRKRTCKLGRTCSHLNGIKEHPHLLQMFEIQHIKTWPSRCVLIVQDVLHHSCMVVLRIFDGRLAEDACADPTLGELWSELPPNRQRRARGQPQQQPQQPTTKARQEHRGQRPNGNKRLHGVGRPRRPDHTKGANSPAKNQPTPQKGNQGAKTQTNQAKPKGEAHEGKATTPKSVQVGKTNKPEGD